MADTDSGAAVFAGLIDLAAERLGGQALLASDEFFAGKENLLKPGRGVFVPDLYTDRGKWMDGWESLRRRGGADHDWCVVRLGAPGVVRGIDIDTNHFLGNHPPYAAVWACQSEADPVAEAREGPAWTEIVPPSPLRPGSQNLFSVADRRRFTHLRLDIYPDGGVARLRAWGEVVPDWSGRDPAEEVDLAAALHGGVVVACSDMFFGGMGNLVMPGRAENMGDGWETRRRRGPGHDWAIVRLGAAGLLREVEVDTNHFKGNHPESFTLEGLLRPGSRLTDLVAPAVEWTPVIGRTRLEAHRQHTFRDVVEAGPFTHARLSVFPDGGVSRLRLRGLRAGAGG